MNPPEPCPDFDGNNAVGFADLSLLLKQWGTAGETDLDGSGNVGFADLTILLNRWGPC